MKITVIGTGFVGVVTSAVFSKLNHEVVGLDIDENKIKTLNNSKVPFYEPQLEELLREAISKDKLLFTTNYQEAITDSDLVVIAVGTPSREDGQADTQYVESSLKSLAPFTKNDVVIVIKSTVPPGFNEKARKILSELTINKFHLASVPEFLKEGTAVNDTLNPDRVIIGTDSEFAKKLLMELHEPLTKNIINMSSVSAQMSKYASNTYLATRITFINQIANLCEQNGADIQEVIKGMGADKRIGGHYWYPGLGYGGSCFPKDVKEIAAYARSVGESDSLFIKIDELNESRITSLMENFDEGVGGFASKTISILGLSFKPETNDIREAPAIKVISWLKNKGAKIKATDPKAIKEMKNIYQDIDYYNTVEETVKDSNGIILLIEWKEYLDLDFNSIKKLMKPDPFLIDTRNQYENSEVEKEGFKYFGVGR